MAVDVVIVGAGIAGLATAYELSRHAVSFTVLERAPRAGGVILSEEIDGYTIDGGADSLLIQKRDGIALCEEIGLGDRLVSTKPPRVAFIQRGGRLHPLPAASVLGIPTRVGPFLRTSLFSSAGKVRMGAELFVPPRRTEDDESIGAFMTRRFGREATTYLAEPLRTGAAVSAITGHGPFVVRTGAGEAIDARAVVLATPAYITSDLMRTRDPDLAQLAGGIAYVSAATVALAFRRTAITHPLNGSGFVVPRVEASGILAGSWLSSKWPHRAPDDRVLMRTFVGGARDPKALERSDEELVSLSLAALQPLVGIRGEPSFARVYRWERANAQHEVGHLTRMAAIERALARHPGMFVTGSGFRGVGIPDCIADGRATARQVATWLKQ